jgi:phosphoribosyl 1,2-cyclic phosphodiesterase
MRIKFWGVRGSTPTPERRNSRYGGNTACVEIRLGNGTLIIFDCGSGLRALGKSLLREFGERPLRGYVFLTHFHWDHIQGIPFFLPLYKKGNVFLFHSVLRKGRELQGAVEGQMINPYFPVDMSVMGAVRHFYDLDEHPVNLNGAIISSAPLYHPQECVGYRIEADGGVFVLATDTEPGSAFHDRTVRELARGADVFVYDAQYTPEQMAAEKKNWGHSSWLEGTRIANEVGAKHLVLFHHDPDHDDFFVDGLVEKARQEFPRVSGASEGLEITLPKGIARNADLAAPSNRRLENRYQVGLPVTVEWAEPGGGTHTAGGVCRDVSRTGIYFVTSGQLRSLQPVQLELIIPDEVTHRGEETIRFLVQPIRQDPLNGAEGLPRARTGVAGRIYPEEPSPLAHARLEEEDETK